MNSNNSNDRGSRRFSIDQSLKKDTDELIRMTLDRKIDTVRDMPAPTPVPFQSNYSVHEALSLAIQLTYEFPEDQQQQRIGATTRCNSRFARGA